MTDTPEPQILDEHSMGDLHLWAPKNFDRARNLTAPEKIANEKLDSLLTIKAEIKAETCWEHDALGCNRKPAYWVREVQFDMKTDSKAKQDFRQVSSADYDGPVPGFCLGHIGSAPSRLAQAVYFARPEMHWGLKPRRWFVIFTDGTKQGGECVSLDPHQIQPDFIEEFKEAHVG